MENNVPAEQHELMMAALAYRLSRETARRRREKQRHAAVVQRHNKELRKLHGALAEVLKCVENFETQIAAMQARSKLLDQELDAMRV